MVVVVLISSVLFDELLLLFLESVPGFSAVFNLLFSTKAGEEQHAQEIEGASRRRSVFPLLDLEMLFSIVSVDSFSHGLCVTLSISILISSCSVDFSPFVMVTLNVVVDVRLRFNGKFDLGLKLRLFN